MSKFLEAVAKRFAVERDLREYCFVFPNRRSSLFFQRYLGIAAGKPVFSPEIKTIDDLFDDLSGLKKLDKIELLYLLYRNYLEVKPPLRDDQPQETFDQFVYWGDIILRDFDDIDKYLVEADKLLLNIKQLKDLSVDYDFLSDAQKSAIAEFCQNFNPDEISVDSKDKKHLFNETWNLLQPLYSSFKMNLLERGQGYQGMIYRSVAENRELGSLLRQRYKHLVFVGLNALNECEKVLLSSAQVIGIGDYYWDFYGKMLTDKENRSSRFVEENVRMFPSSSPLEDIIAPEQQIYEVIKVPSAVGQTRVVKQIMDRLKNEGRLGDLVDTAVVLPDESLLPPMLDTLPPYVDSINVTMGYPLCSSSVAEFFSLLEKLQGNVKEKKRGKCFYHKDVLELLEHPLFTKADMDSVASEIKKEIISKSTIFVPSEVLSSKGELFSIIFKCMDQTAQIPDYQMSVINYIQSFQTEIDREFLYHYGQMVERIKDMDPGLDQMLPKTYYRLLFQCTELISIPYSGEPLSGLQIMGPLETRAVDFKNVIMLSMSEGSFPSKNVSASFIPYNLRKGFGLPTYEYQDSIWAYHFYRSIYRAERIFLLYDSRTDGLQSGEESRYIKQLKYHYNVPIAENIVSYDLGSIGTLPQDLCIRKDDSVVKELEDLFIRGNGNFSASSLNCYIDCPVKFYYKYVKKFKEPDEVVEELDSGLFGTIFHDVMENIYKPFRGKIVKVEDIHSIRERREYIEALVDNAFAQYAKIDEIAGQNLILKQLIMKFADRVLEIDGGMTPFEMVGTETPKEKFLTLSDGRIVKLFGKVDRFDRGASGNVRVVDYKTGKAAGKENCQDVAKIFEDPFGRRPDIAFQLYFYSLLSGYREQCVYPLQNIFKNLPETHLIEENNLQIYTQRVKSLIEEIMNAEVPFEGRSSNGQVCEYCNFRRICRKQ